jgi:hypothetical protein
MNKFFSASMITFYAIQFAFASDNSHRFHAIKGKITNSHDSAMLGASINPVSAMRQPQLIRKGFNHSLELRINGASPAFYMNGNKYALILSLRGNHES